MEYTLPTQIRSFWVTAFFDLQAKTLYEETLVYQANLTRLLQSTNQSALIRQFSDKEYWDKLKAVSNYSDDIEALYDYWQKIAPYAHLTSKQLLNILQECLLPLLTYYEHLLHQLSLEKQNIEREEVWRPKWFINEHERVIGELQTNVQRLTSLRQKLAEALLFRCKAHETLNQPRNVDDVVAALAVKINAIGVQPPLTLPQPLSATLNDDRRMLVYDLLSDMNMPAEEIFARVVAVIQWEGKGTLVSAKEVNKKLNSTHEFSQKIIEDLDLSSFGEHFFILRPRAKLFSARWQKWLNNQLINYIGQQLNAWKGKALGFAQGVWALRYFVYLIGTLMLYHYLIASLQPIILAQFSLYVYQWIAAALFFTVGIAPLWWLGYLGAKQIAAQALKYLLKDKLQQILKGLMSLEKSELFLANHLSPTILDIPSFDSEQLIDSVEKIQQTLRTGEQALKRYRWWEKMLATSSFRAKETAVADKLHEQQQRMQAALTLIAKHISERVSEDIQRLTKAVQENHLVPLLPSQQINQLRSFVENYGDPATLVQFDENTNVVKKWLVQFVSQEKVALPVHLPVAFNQPWGGQQIRIEVFNGWQILLDTFTTGAKKEAALQLHAVLTGKQDISRQQFLHIMEQLAPQDPAILLNLQWFLFNTLNNRPFDHAKLLSEQHIKIVSDWYHQYEKEITEAKTVFDEIFSSPREAAAKLAGMRDQELTRYYELLDGADIYASATGKEQGERQNKVRQFFENYQGEHSRAYHFIKFVPAEQKNSVLFQIARKRLGWIIDHLGAGVDARQPFEAADDDLFHNFLFLEKNEQFNFAHIVGTHEKYFGVYDENMEYFLKACHQNGFGSGLLTRYIDKNARVKPFIMSQQRVAQVSESTLPANPQTLTAPTKRRMQKRA